MLRDVTIIGDGGWGTTIGILLCQIGHRVTLWSAFPKHIATIKSDGENRKFLPGIKIPAGIKLVSDISELPKSELIVIAVPTKYLRKTVSRFKGKFDAGKVVSLTKGIEAGTLKRPSLVLSEFFSGKIAVISGPSITFEVARGLPTTVVAASEDRGYVEEVRDIFTTPGFRVYTSRDPIGVELGGALKNIIAIAAGISDGMGFGVNTKAAILTRGLAEITRIGVKLGARKETFFGLSGIGDLATTCMSEHSRNRWLGEEIGKGRKLKDILKGTEMAVEGVNTTRSAYELSKKIGVEMPITEKIYQVLYEDKDPKIAVKELMTRAPKPEGI
ncbi:MAG: NAD(P)H-dependent glycerol-3-phosphate dehydrogenase [Candidatus Omnitrophota bacterium]